jgi:hypothetical protein
VKTPEVGAATPKAGKGKAAAAAEAQSESEAEEEEATEEETAQVPEVRPEKTNHRCPVKCPHRPIKTFFLLTFGLTSPVGCAEKHLLKTYTGFFI